MTKYLSRGEREEEKTEVRFELRQLHSHNSANVVVHSSAMTQECIVCLPSTQNVFFFCEYDISAML